MAGRAKRRDENGRKLPWRPPGARPVTAADHPHAIERAIYRKKGDAVKTPLPHDALREANIRRRMEKEAFPVSKGLPERPPNPRLLTDAQLLALVKQLEHADRYDWSANARPEQLEPEEYRNWLIVCGRGWGKTKCASETIRKWTNESPGCRIAIVAKDSRTLRDVNFEGVSGLMSVFKETEVKSFFKGLGDCRMDLANGSKIIGFSAEAPDSLRGHSFDGAVMDEFAAWPKHLAQDAYDQTWFTLRQAKNPRVIITTTPKRVPHLMSLMERADEPDSGIVLTRGVTSDNKVLTKEALSELAARYAGTHLGRQELGGELLMDVEGALWVPPMLEAARYDGGLPTFRKVIIGVDPSGSATGDATGIVAIGYTNDKRIFVLGCYSTKGLPAVRYGAVCRAAVKHRQDGIPLEVICEYNHGGDNTIFAIENTWKHMVQTGEIDSGERKPLIKKSTLKGSKAQKAGPIASLYEQQMNLDISRVWHVPATRSNGLDGLESELLSWAVTDKQSPNNLDAYVVAGRRAMQELGLESTLGTPGPRRVIQDGYRPF